MQKNCEKKRRDESGSSKGRPKRGPKRCRKSGNRETIDYRYLYVTFHFPDTGFTIIYRKSLYFLSHFHAHSRRFQPLRSVISTFRVSQKRRSLYGYRRRHFMADISLADPPAVGNTLPSLGISFRCWEYPSVIGNTLPSLGIPFRHWEYSSVIGNTLPFQCTPT